MGHFWTIPNLASFFHHTKWHPLPNIPHPLPTCRCRTKRWERITKCELCQIPLRWIAQPISIFEPFRECLQPWFNEAFEGPAGCLSLPDKNANILYVCVCVCVPMSQSFRRTISHTIPRKGDDRADRTLGKLGAGSYISDVIKTSWAAAARVWPI